MNTGYVMLVVAAACATGVLADMTDARCDIYPAGEDRATKMVACTFSQRQGAVTITRADGVGYDLSPVGDAPGNYVDQQGQPAHRESGLGDAGQIYRFKGESVYVYWDTTALSPASADADNWTAPYTTADYDATTRLPCGPLGSPGAGTCPAGIQRMDQGQASIVITSPTGQEFTVNFMTDYVNAAGREVDAKLDGDSWIVNVDGKETYTVPRAAIEGG